MTENKSNDGEKEKLEESVTIACLVQQHYTQRTLCQPTDSSRAHLDHSDVHTY